MWGVLLLRFAEIETVVALEMHEHQVPHDAEFIAESAHVMLPASATTSAI
jgi:hypothetical protein